MMMPTTKSTMEQNKMRTMMATTSHSERDLDSVWKSVAMQQKKLTGVKPLKQIWTVVQTTRRHRSLQQHGLPQGKHNTKMVNNNDTALIGGETTEERPISNLTLGVLLKWLASELFMHNSLKDIVPVSKLVSKRQHMGMREAADGDPGRIHLFLRCWLMKLTIVATIENEEVVMETRCSKFMPV